MNVARKVPPLKPKPKLEPVPVRSVELATQPLTGAIGVSSAEVPQSNRQQSLTSDVEAKQLEVTVTVICALLVRPMAKALLVEWQLEGQSNWR